MKKRTYLQTFQVMKLSYKAFGSQKDDKGCEVCEEFGKGLYKCPNCGRRVFDFNYFDNLKRMEEKYGTGDLFKMSCEKLTFAEIVTIKSFIERADHHFGDDGMSSNCAGDGTFSNLARRLGEIEDEYAK